MASMHAIEIMQAGVAVSGVNRPDVFPRQGKTGVRVHFPFPQPSPSMQGSQAHPSTPADPHAMLRSGTPARPSSRKSRPSRSRSSWITPLRPLFRILTPCLWNPGQSNLTPFRPLFPEERTRPMKGSWPGTWRRLRRAGSHRLSRSRLGC